MKLGVISDVHGNLLALEVVLAELRNAGVDAIVNLGDAVSAPLWPRETCELLAASGVHAVRGNHDRWLVEDPPAGLTPTIDRKNVV